MFDDQEQYYILFLEKIDFWYPQHSGGDIGDWGEGENKGVRLRLNEVVYASGGGA